MQGLVTKRASLRGAAMLERRARRSLTPGCGCCETGMATTCRSRIRPLTLPEALASRLRRGPSGCWSRHPGGLAAQSAWSLMATGGACACCCRHPSHCRSLSSTRPSAPSPRPLSWSRAAIRCRRARSPRPRAWRCLVPSARRSRAFASTLVVTTRARCGPRHARSRFV